MAQQNFINWLVITPESPLHLGEPKPNFSFLPTKDIISGSVIRGSLAHYLIATRDEDKISSLVSKSKFGFFFPTHSRRLLPLPIPITARTCKSNPGFKNEKGHGVFDTLLISLAYEELKSRGFNLIPLSFNCPDCKDRVDKPSFRFYVREKVYKEVKVGRVSQTKVALSRRRRAAEEEMLYSVTALTPGAEFVGRVIVQDEKTIETLKQALEEYGLGGLTSRGYGQVKAALITDPEIEPLFERIKGFNEKLEQVWEEVSSIAIGEGDRAFRGVYFSIDLLSPTLLSDEYGLPTLKLCLDLPKGRLEPIFWAVEPTFISGWSTAWGLPKDTTYGVQIGGTYVFKVEEETEELLHLLERLELEGIGERTEEGFGQLLVCHPFHREVVPV